MEDSDADMREPHHRSPPEYVDEEYVTKHRVMYWKVDADNYEEDETYKKVVAERNYPFGDVITISKEKLPNYEQKLKEFYAEHIHIDEEVRFCLEGSGFFDFRDYQDRWVRILFTKGDIIVLPAGIYHRFTLDNDNYVKAKRMFAEVPEWTAYYRPSADENPRRVAYVESIKHLKDAS